MSRATDNIAKLKRIYSVAEPRFGYVIGGADNTTAIQLAIDAAINDEASLFFPGGLGPFWYQQLTIDGNIRLFGDEPAQSLLKQVSGVNDHGIIVAYTVVQPPIIESLTIDGNRSGNSAGNALHLEDHIEPSAAVTYGFAVVLRNVYVQNAAGECLHVGVNRNLGHVENSEFKRGAKCVSINSSSDWRFMHGRFAFPLSSHAIEVVNGADNVFVGGSAYGAIGEACVRVQSSSSSPTKFIGMTR